MATEAQEAVVIVVPPVIALAAMEEVSAVAESVAATPLPDVTDP